MITPPLIVSILALFLSFIAIRRQNLPSKYEAERRIKEQFQLTDPELVITTNQFELTMPSISVKPHKGVKNRIIEHLTGNLRASTQIIVTTHDKIPSGEIPNSVKANNFSVISVEGHNIALKFELETADPSEVHREFMKGLQEEIREELIRDPRPPV